MSFHGGAAPGSRSSPINPDHAADAALSDADWHDAMAQDDLGACEHRPMVAARGIIIGIIVSIPLWALFAVVAYLLI